MSVKSTPIFPSWEGGVGARGGWAISTALYVAFAVAVFVVQGGRPLLGPDHLSYFQLADSIMASCPGGDYWRETMSIRNFGVILAYLHGWTGSHVLSMKVVLVFFTVFYLLAAELFFRLFAGARWQAMLFAILSGFAVSFGIASWGVTDSTALLPRTLVAPIIMLAVWMWFRYDGHPVRYLVFTLLIVGSLLHLSAFYAIGVLVIVEAWDFIVLRRGRLDRLLPAFLGSLVLATSVLFTLEVAGLSSRVIGIQIPEMLRSMGLKVPNVEVGLSSRCSSAARSEPANYSRKLVNAFSQDLTRVSLPLRPVAAVPTISQSARPAAPASEVGQIQAGPISAQEAWDIELRLRPWRNMPLPLVNVANALSSFALILVLALAGMAAAKRSGFTRIDGLMLGMFLAAPIFAFGPQTVLWVLRSFTSIYPATIEEVRAVSLIMIPSLYFVLRLFRGVFESGGHGAKLKAGAIAVAVVFLPLFMKNLPNWAREGIFSVMVSLRVVDPGSDSRVANARAALGLVAGEAPLFYATQGVRDWLMENSPPGSRILTDRDDMILLRDRVVVGPRQLTAVSYYATAEETKVFLQTSQAMAAKDAGRLADLARIFHANFIVVPGRLQMAAYADENFSVIRVQDD